MVVSLVISTIILELAFGKYSIIENSVRNKTVLHKGITYNYIQGSMVVLYKNWEVFGTN